MSKKKAKTSKPRITIPEEVEQEVLASVVRFNRKNMLRGDCFYEAQFKGKYCYLNRCDFGQMGAIARLTYQGKADNWEFAIFKWSSETYDPNECWFPGFELLDGTVEGAMKAGMEAYPF